MIDRSHRFGRPWRRLAGMLAATAARARGGPAPASPAPAATGVGGYALHDAIASGGLLLEYQPKLHLRRQEIASLEALVRWQHPVQGRLYPGSFIPTLEESGDIGALTHWVIDQVIIDQRRFAAAGHDLPVFVNIAAKLLADDAFVAAACARIQAGGARIGMEITETSVIRDPNAAIANLRHVSSLGIPVSIDDYGSGLSSLVYLKQLPAGELKIDKLFITELTSSHRDPLIVRSTIDLAHAMEMEVVAEGVESQATLALLSIMGCDMAQGYWICRPIELPAMLDFLNTRKDNPLDVTPAFKPFTLRLQG